MEEALYEITSMRQFARLTLSDPIPEETTIMNLRRLLEKHQLAACILETINNYLRDKGLSLRQGTIVDATIIHTPCSTKNKKGKRDPEMHQTKKGCIEVRHGSGWCLHTEALTGDAGSSTGEWPQPMEGAKESPLLGGPRSITRRDGFAHQQALVQKSRASLLARGGNPSIDAVRVELGNTGSKMTNSRYLQELDKPISHSTPI